MEEANFGSLYLDEEDNDVTIKFENKDSGSSLSIPAHGFVLSRTSDVFKTMLKKDTFKECYTNVITIDISGDVHVGFHFVKYLYTKTLADLELDLYIILMKMAHMYNISRLLELCENRIQTQIDIVSVCRIYQTLEVIISKQFGYRCMLYMLKYAFAIFMDCHHVCLNESTMISLLKSDDLTVVNEDQVLEAVYHWGRARCIQENKPVKLNIQSAVAKMLTHIRWSLLPLDCPLRENFTVVKESRFRTDSNRTGFLSYLSINSCAKQLKLGDLCMETATDFQREGQIKMIQFTSNQDIFLSGVSFVIFTKYVKYYQWKDLLKVTLNDIVISNRLTPKQS